MRVSEEHQDALRELLNLGVGRAAASLNEMLEAHVTLTVPELYLLTPEEFVVKYPDPRDLSIVRMNIGGDFKGTVGLAFPPESAVRLVSVLTGEKSDSDDLDSVRAGTLSEVGNIIINSVMGAIGNFLGRQIEFGLPVLDSCPLVGFVEECIGSDDAIIMVGRTRFDVTELQVDGEILVVFESNSFQSLIQALDAIDATSD